MSVALEVKSLTKVYKLYRNNRDRLLELLFGGVRHKRHVANDNISFTLRKGQTLGIIGVNGAGKSTLLKMIAGVCDPTSGVIRRFGRVTPLLELGTGFNPQMSGFDNIELNGTLLGMSRAEVVAKRAEIIAFSELGTYIQEPVITYSSGMKMRLAFAIAIFSEPQILIVDEALSVGDAHFSAKCHEALRARKAGSMSIIYVSHDLNSLKMLCDEAILLNNGSLVAHGEPQRVMNRYNQIIARLDHPQAIDLAHSSAQAGFGTLDAEIISAKVQGADSLGSVLSSGEPMSIEVVFECHRPLSDLTVGIAIRDRFGQEIFGTNSAQHKSAYVGEAGSCYYCTFTMQANVGVGHYSVSVALHGGEKHLQSCYHWVDFAADFEVAGVIGAPFVGVCRLEPRIEFGAKPA